jgi:hypothetical protein
MDHMPEVFVAVFEDATRASAVDRELAALATRGHIGLLATAVVTRDREGCVGWSVGGAGVGHICARADTIATILGVLLPTPVLVAGLAATSYDGPERAAAEREFGEGFAQEVAVGVPPGGSVFIGVVEDDWVPEVERGLRGYHHLTRKRS